MAAQRAISLMGGAPIAGTVSRSVAWLPVLLCIGCDAQLACASRLSHFTLLGNDPTLRGLHPLYLTPLPNGPFPWCPPDCYRCQRTPTGHATLGGEIAPALTPPRARMSIMPRPMTPIARGTLSPGLILVPWAHSPIWSRQHPIFVSLIQIASYKR